MSDEPKFTQADIDKAIADAKTGLEAKNTELLDEVKKIKAELRKTQEINPADLERLEAENEKLKADLTAAQKQAKDATTAAEKATKALEAESGFTHKLLVENGLREQLAANNVTDPIYQKAAMAMLASGVQIAAEGDTRVAKVGDKALADFVKEWAGTDEGKRLVSAPNNSGGGAPGGGGAGGTGKTVDRATFDGMSQPERMAFTKEGGKVTEAA